MTLLLTEDNLTYYIITPYLEVVPGYHSRSVIPSSYDGGWAFLDGTCITVKDVIIINIVYAVYSQHYRVSWSRVKFIPPLTISDVVPLLL